MARVSRKNISASVQTVPSERVYQTCLYLRLSKEDSGYENHDSIEMQEYLLEQYVQAQPDMKLVKVFCDNGSAGTDFNRPAFEQMMDAVRRREVDCIIVKDLSRFGRNYVETGYYLEKIFPDSGVRFVAVGDSLDTLKSEKADEMVVPLKNIVNSLFAKDISKKSGSALHLKQENGEFIGSRAPYGYQKNPQNKHQLIIDPETAPVVSNIFAWRSEGMGYGAIAKKLNSQNVPCPSMTHLLKEVPETVSRLWVPATIKSITGNMVYAGHMAQGKQVRSLCDGIPKTEAATRDWIIVRETHEPIVSEDVWNAVSSINRAAHNRTFQKQQQPKTENILSGLVFCKDCQRTMARVKNCSLKGHIRYTYNCRLRKISKGESGCTNKNIGETELLDIILQSIRSQIAAAVNQETLLEKLQDLPALQTEQKKQELDYRLKSIRAAINRNRTRRLALFESYSDKLVTNKEYQYMKEQYDTKAMELSAQEESLLSLQSLCKNTTPTENTRIKAFRTYQRLRQITRETAVNLIHHITIEGRCDVHIFWSFKDEYAPLLSSMTEVPI